MSGEGRQRPVELERLQRHFWQLITAPEGVRAGLAALADREPTMAPLCSWLKADDEPSAIRRLDIYANMYFYRLLDCLKEDFRASVVLIGETAFHNLVTDYLAAHPPNNHSLRYLGAALPAFIARHPLADSYPQLADLATLEWARITVFDATEAPLLELGALAALPTEAWAELPLRAIPACRLVELSWSVQRAWQQVRVEGRSEAAALSPAQPLAATFLVWRQGFVVYHRPLTDVDECQVLGDLLRTPSTFGELCSGLASADPSLALEAVARRAAGLLRRWIEAGLLHAG